MSLDLVVTCVNRETDWEHWLSSRNPLLINPCLKAVILVGSTHVAYATRNGIDHFLTPTEHCHALRAGLSKQPFNKAKTLRLGASYSDAETVFFLDCDLRISPSTVKMLYEECHYGPAKTCLYLERVVESSRQLRLLKYNGYLPVLIPDSSGNARITLKPWQTSGWRPGFGNVIVSRQLYLEVGMHDPCYTQYGWEDLDLLIRLQLAGAKVHARGQACHISHPDSWRSLNDKSRQQSTMFMQGIFLDKFRHLMITNDADASHFT
jgi:hypothetical protein